MSNDSFYSLRHPLALTPVGQEMRAANLCGVPGFTHRRGVNPFKALERFDIDPLQVCNPDLLVDSKAVVDLFEYFSATFDDPLFGIHLAQTQEPDIFGCVTALCRAAPTLRQALECFVTYMPVVHSAAFTLELAEGNDRTELRWGIRSVLDHGSQANYQGVMLIIKLLRQIVGASFGPDYVTLPALIPAKHRAEIENALGCRVRVAEKSSIAFSSHLLDQPANYGNRLTFQLIKSYLERVRTSARTSLADRVHDHLRGSLPSGNLSLDSCAETLGMSIRTLQGKLSSLDLKYSDILERVRFEVAVENLADTELDFARIAENLGYAEQSSFGRAFKRWSGMTPSHYRQTHYRQKQYRQPDPS